MDAQELNQLGSGNLPAARLTRRIKRDLRALLLASVFGYGCTPALYAQGGTPPAATGVLKVGVFSGGFDPKAAAQYETWLGRKSDFNVEFLTDTAFTDSTSADGNRRENDALTHAGWLLGVWRGAGSRGERNMLFSIPLATKQDNSLAHVASGQYDTVYQQIAKDYAQRLPDGHHSHRLGIQRRLVFMEGQGSNCRLHCSISPRRRHFQGGFTALYHRLVPGQRLLGQLPGRAGLPGR